MPSRLIEHLTPETQEKFRLFAGKMAEKGIPFMLTCTYRSQAEQDALYAIGRTAPGSKVTWTKASRHTRRTAFDIAILKDGKPVWDTKVDVNVDLVPDYLEAGQIGESVGLEWGGRWRSPDFPHFQLPG
jgi:peptidoglycan L-alanyl-D-glutamate endopeptidase CwlK